MLFDVEPTHYARETGALRRFRMADIVTESEPGFTFSSIQTCLRDKLPILIAFQGGSTVLTQAFSWRCRPAHAAVVVMAVFSMLLASCGSRKDLQTAEQAVGEFHSQLDAEQYSSIYAQTSEGFRKATNETDFTALLQVIHRKLGRSGNSRRQNFQVNFSTGQGEVVTLEYHTDFEGGAGDESFLWQFSSGHPMLLGYHINSNALILK